jgi:hypothetical protein
MPPRISRGLLATDSKPLVRKLDPEELAERRIIRLQSDPLKGYSWKETWQWAARLARGDGDERGRRLFSDAGFTDARYVQRIAHRAALGIGLPETKVDWGHLRNAIERIHEELQAGTKNPLA